MAGEYSQSKDQWKDKPKDRSFAASSSASHRARGRSPALSSFSRRDPRRPSSSSTSPARKRPVSRRSPEDLDRSRKAARHSPAVQRDDDLYRPGTETRREADREPARQRRPSPRRTSPDSYVPSSKRRPFRIPPGASTYRPGEGIARHRSPTPSRHPKSRRNLSPRSRRRSPSPYRSRRPSPRRGRREADTYAPAPARTQRSRSRDRRSPPRRSPPRSPRERSRNRKTRHQSRSTSRHRQDKKHRSPSGKTNMRPSYHPYAGRGGSRPPHDPYSHAGSPQHYAPPPPPIPPHHHSPYGAGRGWPAQSPYPPSHHGSPYHHPPHRQATYPPPTATPNYFPPPPPPPPPQYYGGTPPYPPQGYPHPDRRSSAGHSPPAGRGGPANRRGHFSNLSWTPATGSRGGAHTTPKKESSRDNQHRFEHEEDEEDDPFRPSKDLRAEDENRHDSGRSHASSKADADPDNKFQFALKGKSVTPRHAPSTLEKPVKKEMQLVKRIKPRPTLPPEFAASESVYYRKPGNESVVGSGTYGKVFRAIHVYTGEKVALKKIRMEGERDGFPVTAIREVKLLQSLNNDNVVKLQEVMVEKNDCYMVFEYLSHDLTGLLNHPTFKLEPAHKKHLARQLFEGLDHLHRRGVLHRDIKAANILISNTGQLKLADFGLARFFAKRRQLDYTNRVITIWYRSPELLLGETQYGPAVDIWSAACVLVEIFTKHAIFPGDGGEINQLDKIYNVLGTPMRSDWPGIVDMAWFELLKPTDRRPSTFAEKYKDRITPAAFELLTAMFAFDPVSRPNAEEVLRHAYFLEEEPRARRAVELQELEGDWHEFESKALRKEKERKEREERKIRERGEYEGRKVREREEYEGRKVREREREEYEAAKRKKVDVDVEGEGLVEGVSNSEGREAKRVRTEDQEGDISLSGEMEANGTSPGASAGTSEMMLS